MDSDGDENCAKYGAGSNRAIQFTSQVCVCVMKSGSATVTSLHA
jgi:hypothetical protein